MSDNRTQQPTAKRRQQARQEGRVVASSQVVGVVIWLAVAAILFSMGGTVLTSARQEMERIWAEPLNFAMFNPGEQLHLVLVRLLFFAIPVLGSILLLAIFTRLAQVGFIWAPMRISPQVNRLNPSRNFGSLFSADTMVQFVRGAGITVSAFSLMVFGLWAHRDTLMGLTTVPDFAGEMIRLLSGWALRLGGCLAVFAAADYSYQRYRFEMSVQMSLDEVRDEVRAIEGNTQVAAQRKHMHQQVLGSGENLDEQTNSRASHTRTAQSSPANAR